ncbi:hypothetical protein ACHAWO_004128 [Cyclotella atomus]|uniref:SGNH domain-containing protein n=1 Tax=Cyclotella atomus TaxID=382360 RepID=A0ABD3NAB1_9STRA
MITCDMEKGVGSCVDPVGVEGEWVLLEPEQVLAAPVCCEWLRAKFKENEKQCGTEQLQLHKKGDFRGNPDFYTQTSGCYCSNFKEKYVWQSPNLLSHSKFDPIDTCRLLGDREVLFIGDSTSAQAASTLMNTLYPGGCQNQIISAASDTLIGLSHKRGKTWKAWVEEFDHPDIVIVTMGAHVPKFAPIVDLKNESVYEMAIDQILEEMREMREQFPDMKFAWKTQQPGGCTTEILEPTNSTKAAYTIQDVRYNWGQFYERDLYLISRLQRVGMPYLDLRMLYSRSDGHISSQLNDGGHDCLHLCHGPLDVMGRLFHQLLSSL